MKENTKRTICKSYNFLGSFHFIISDNPQTYTYTYIHPKIYILGAPLSATFDVFRGKQKTTAVTVFATSIPVM